MIRSITRLFSRIGTSISNFIKKIRISPKKPKYGPEPTESVENLYSTVSNSDIPPGDNNKDNNANNDKEEKQK